MVIFDLVRAVGPLSHGGTAVVPVGQVAEIELARRWAAHTGNTIVSDTFDGAGPGSVLVRRGRQSDPALELGADRLPGARVWIYTNFHCNLACDYCCVQSSPRAPRRELGAELIGRLVLQAATWGVRELYLTGGEPFLLPDIGQIIASCAAVLPTTVLTNGMLFRGRGLAVLQQIPRDRVVLQISLDSASAGPHDVHRGAGSWARAVDGIRVARAEGFRVRVAATIGSPEPGALADLRRLLDSLDIAVADQVIRPVALQGAAIQGVRLTRETLVPELTVTADGIYWHPVAATDDMALLTRRIDPLGPALDEMTKLFAEQWARTGAAAALFPCA